MARKDLDKQIEKYLEKKCAKEESEFISYSTASFFWQYTGIVPHYRLRGDHHLYFVPDRRVKSVGADGTPVSFLLSHIQDCGSPDRSMKLKP